MSPSEHSIRGKVASDVRAAVARKQVRLDALSEATGIPKSTLSTKLRGRTDFTVPELFDLAGALDVPAMDLLASAFGTGGATAVAS